MVPDVPRSAEPVTERPPARAGAPVLQVVTSTDRRGAESFAVDLGPALSALGREVHTVALRPGGGDAAFPLPVLSERGSLREAVVRLRRERAGVGCVVAHGSRTLLASFAATVGTPTPFVYRLIGDPAYWASTPARRARVGFLLRRAAAVAVYYQSAADQLVRQYRLPSAKVHVIPKGVDLARFPTIAADERADARRRFGIDASTPVAAFVGALSAEKDPLLAVRLAEERTDLRVLVVGDGPLRPEVAARAAATDRRVELVGRLADPRPAVAAADVVVLPSRSEGVPSVAIEAALAGLPVVATEVGGVPEVVHDRRTGRLFEPGDVAGARRALDDALAHRLEWGAEGARRARADFDLERTAAAWNELLVEISSSGRARPWR